MSETTSISPLGYACPTCRRPLRSAENALYCPGCNRTYPIVGDIPDFVSEDLLPRVDPNDWRLKMADSFFGLLAPMYESRLWQSFVLSMAGAGGSSLGSIARFISETLEGVAGSILDVACGPATYGRRMASPDRSVYGVDVSLGALQQGMKNIARDQAPNIHLARTRVEALPFEDAVFDAAICGGALHLFPDTALALHEIARTLKTGAPLAVTTFVTGDSLAARFVKPTSAAMHVFALPQLQQALTEAGFEEFASKQDGTFITFSVRKTAPRVERVAHPIMVEV